METHRLGRSFPPNYNRIRWPIFMCLIVASGINGNDMWMCAVCTGCSVRPIIWTTSACVLVRTSRDYVANRMSMISVSRARCYMAVRSQLSGGIIKNPSTGKMPRHSHGASCSTNGNHQHGTWGEDSNSPLGYYDSNRSYVGSNGGKDNGNPLFNTTINGNHSHTVTIASTGGSGYHENRMPYVVVNRWKRTA